VEMIVSKKKREKERRKQHIRGRGKNRRDGKEETMRT
jgi:hypothetical protein